VQGGHTGAEGRWQATAPLGHQPETPGPITMPQIPIIPEIPPASPQGAISGISGISDNKEKAGPFDLNRWHHAIHGVTGDMALRFNRASAADLKRWAKMLRDIADAMEAAK
jgi:hypothetical protein